MVTVSPSGNTTAAVTYTPIQTQTISGSSTTSVTFSSVPGTYKDLVVVMSVAPNAAGSNFELTFNSDTGNNYSRTSLSGNGTSASSSRESSYSSFRFLSTSNTANLFSLATLQIMNYANTTTYKSLINRNNQDGGSEVGVQVGLWRSTAAITTVTLSHGNALRAGSTFTLYGIGA